MVPSLLDCISSKTFLFLCNGQALGWQGYETSEKGLALLTELRTMVIIFSNPLDQVWSGMLSETYGKGLCIWPVKSPSILLPYIIVSALTLSISEF